MARLAIIGASGTIGTALRAALGRRHTVIGLSRKSDPAVDMADPAGLAPAFAVLGPLDGIICSAASVSMAPLADRGVVDMAASIAGKLLGQMELIRLAALHLTDHGSITLTSGTFDVLGPGAALGAMVNAGLETYVRAAASEMPRGIRVNIVSPGWVAETLAKLGRNSAAGTPLAIVVQSYIDAVEGNDQGRVLRPGMSSRPV